MHTSIDTHHHFNIEDGAMAPIMVSEQELTRLTALLRAAHADEVDERLGEELERAVIVPSTEIPPDIVTMNSRVTFVDAATGAASTLVLVYPHDANAAEGRLSVFAPIGAALLGLAVGQSITWDLPHGRTRTIRVTAVDRAP
jgi:regulator of nucleoside diphosphate kinase